MNNHKFIYRNLAIVLVVLLISSACGAKIKSPLADIETGPAQTVDIQVPIPEVSTGVVVNLDFIAGDFKLAPGTSDYLVSGTAVYNATVLKPIIETNGTSYKVKSGEFEIKGIPTCPDNITNEWDLQLANVPMSLNIKAGAYDANIELGGLSLEQLSIDEIGSDITLNFSSLNQVEMSTFKYLTGGSNMVLKGLANANFEQMDFESGAGTYTLSFDGDLQRDANVSIKSGAATINIIVPKGVNAQVTYNGGLSGVTLEGGWSQNGNIYTLSGSGPNINFTVDFGLGALYLKTE